MKHWITKYWKPVIFTTAFLICISFFVNLLAIGSSYSDGVDAQAAERAYNYALEQSLRIRDQYDALKTTTEWYATELGLCADGAETVGYLQTIRLDLHEKNPDFRDIFYFRDGVLYDLNDRAVTGYPALTELGSAEGSTVSRVFQYENLLMSFGVSAPVEGGSIDRLVLLFDRIAVSLDNFMYHTQQDGSRGLIDSVSSAEFLLFCKSDGVILERQVNSEEYFSPGNESVKSGILKQLFQSGTEYDEVLSSTAGGSIRTFPIRTDTGRFVLTVTSFGAGNGGGFLLGLYNMENLYGSGHSLMDSMWGTLVLLGVILLLFAVMFVTDQIRVNRKISRLTTMNEELDCLTQNGFESVARDLIDANRTSRYAIVMMQVNNFGYHLNARDIDLISNASALHDIGKIAIDKSILNKPGKLTPEELELVKSHTVIGADMLWDLEEYRNEPLVRYAWQICRYHHEHYDGSGYPEGLKGEDIPIAAQVVAVCDVYDELVSKRVYKDMFSHEKAMQIICGEKKEAFNPILLECLQEMSDELIEMYIPEHTGGGAE